MSPCCSAPHRREESATVACRAPHRAARAVRDLSRPGEADVGPMRNSEEVPAAAARSGMPLRLADLGARPLPASRSCGPATPSMAPPRSNGPGRGVPRGWNRGRIRRVLTETPMNTGVLRCIRAIAARTQASRPSSRRPVLPAGPALQPNPGRWPLRRTAAAELSGPRRASALGGYGHAVP